MEIDFAKQSIMQTFAKEMERRRKNRLCFKYRKEGYIASFYKQNYKKPFKKGGRRLLNKQLHTAIQVNITNSKEWQSLNKADFKYSKLEDWEREGSEQYDLTVLEEQQITNIVCKEQQVVIWNKKAVLNTKVQTRSVENDATHPDHLVYKTLLYKACAASNCKYY
jgi:hypothetical protein